MHFRLIGLIGILAFLVSLVTFANPGAAQAALTLNNFIGFETNGLDEAQASAGSPTLVGSPVHAGDFALQLDASSKSYDLAMITGGTTDSDNDFIVGFLIRWVDVTVSSERILFEAIDDAAGVVFTLRVPASTDDLLARDAEGTQIGSTIIDAFPLNQYLLIEIRWQHLASGAFDLHIDGISEISETSLDLTDGNTVSADDAVYRFQGMDSGDFFIDDVYAYSGASGTGDFLGDAEVFRYQANTNSTTEDAVCSSGGQGPLDQGVWQDLGETPLSSDGTEPGYTSASTGGVIHTDDTQSGDNYRPGPNSDPNIDGDSNITGGKWLQRVRRTNGSGTSMNICFGSSSSTTDENISSTIATSFSNFFNILPAGDTDLPTSTEYAAYGLRKGSGSRDMFGEEMWAFILHVPDTGTTRRIFQVQ